jgi:hypothetical protein
LVVPGWPSPTCWDGELTIHTKRLRVFKVDSRKSKVSVRRVREGIIQGVDPKLRRTPLH